MCLIIKQDGQKGFIEKATFEQRFETGEVINPTNICMKTVLPRQYLQSF